MEDRHLDLLLEQGNNLEKTLGTSVEAQAAILQEQKKATKHLEEMSSSVRDVMENSGDEVVKGFMKLFKGEKGEKGDKGDSIKGDKGDKGEKGDTGDTGADGKDGRDGKDGKDGSPDTPGQVKNKLESLSVGNRLSYTKLDDTPDLEELYMKAVRVSSKTVSLTELDDVDLDGLQIENGKYVLASTIDLTGTANRITIGGTATHPTIDIASTYTGQSSITTLGTITTGVWNGTAIQNAYLANSAITIGTTSISLGDTTASLAGLDYLNFDATAGATGYGFRDNAGVMEYKDSGGSWIPLATSIAITIGEPVSGGNNTSVLFIDSSGNLAQDTHFTYNATTDALHIHALAGDATDGLLIESDNGTDIGILGAANSANVTWYGSHNFNAQTANTIAIFGASKTLSSADTATYPSLTELAYVKGVTSAIQTQINTKAPTDAPTFTTSITGSYLTASELLITNGSKQIVSAAVATYPSLTELTYLKGVTSAIQTQFTGKASTTLNNLGTTAINASLLFDANATYDIGSTTNGIDDLFIGAAGVINFAAGDVTITHGTNTLSFAGASTAYNFDNVVKIGNVLGGTYFGFADSGSSNAYRGAVNLASSTADMQFYTASGTAGSETFAERMRIINASGVLTIGGTVAYGREGQLFEVNTSANDGGVALNTWAASSEGGILDFNKSRSATKGTYTIVQNGDALGGIYFRGANGSSFDSAAAIVAYVDGTPGASNDMPGVLAFYTTANGSGSLSERMRIENNGYTGIGTNDPQTVLHVFNGSGETFRITNTAGAGFYCETRSSASSSDIGFATLGTGKLILRAGGDTFQITSANAYFPTIGTTASAANAFLNSGSTPANELLRSTSSRVYKKDIEDMDHAYADNILKLRPVWYRSKCENDPEDFSYWGLIAEEVAEIDPRLVQWGYHNDDWDEEVVDEDGKVIKPRTLKKGAVKKPDGVTYDRLSVLLLDVVKRQEARIKQLESNTN